MVRTMNARWQLPAMMVLSAASQVVGLVRAGVVARSFGASVQYDAYVLAGSVVSLGLVLIGSGVSTVLVPAFAQGRDRHQVNAFMTFLLVAGALTGLVMAVCAAPILRLAGARPEVVSAAGVVVGLVLAAQYVATLTAVSTAYLNALGSFTVPQAVALAATALQLVLVVADPGLTVIRFALYVLACQVAAALTTTVCAYRRGLAFRPRLSWRRDRATALIALLAPTVCSAGAYQVSTLIDSVLAARVGVGAPTYLSYAIAVSGIVQAVLLGNVQAFAYSRISRAAVTGGRGEVLTRYATVGLACAVLACAGFVAVGRPAVALLLGGQGFGEQGLRAVSVCAFILLLALPPGVVRQLLYNQFNADLDTRTPFRNSLLATVVNLVVSVAGAQVLGLYGVVLGTTVTAYFSTSTMVLRTCRRYGLGRGDLVDVARRLGVLLVAGVLAAVVGCVAAGACARGGAVVQVLCGGGAVVVSDVLVLALARRVLAV